MIPKAPSPDHSRTNENIEIVVLDPPPPSPPKPTKKAQQVVEQTQSINKEEPKDTKYLSAENQRVERETRARKIGDFNNEAGGNNPTPRKTPKNVQKNTQNHPLQAKSQQTQQTQQTQKQAEQTQKQAEQTQKQAEQTQKQAEQKDNKGTLPALKDLMPKMDFKPKKHVTHNAANPKSQRKAGRESASHDYLKDREKGIQTLLNTREFAYYSYYHRIRKKIQLFWEPAIKQKIRHIFATGRRLASTQDRITKVIIVLNNRGQLVAVQVLGESGIRDLDDAAVEAFRSAEPFPNPPKGMTEKDGKIRIRWDFVLEV